MGRDVVEEASVTGEVNRPVDDGASVAVRDVAERARLEAHVGTELAGHTTRRLWSGQLVLIHTVTEPTWQGRGVATAMTLAACDLARANGLHVIPRCPVAATVIARHPEQHDLVEERYRHLLHDHAAPVAAPSEGATR